MRVLLTHRFFWPDTPPYATMLRLIGESLADAGHEVHIFSSVPSYRGAVAAPRRDRLGRLSVRRCFAFQNEKRFGLLRMANVVLYCLALFFTVLRLRPDVVSVSTYPPVVAAGCASLAARLCGARLVYHVQDIHPEMSRISGGRLGRGAAFRALLFIDRQTCRRAHAIVTLSKDMAETLRARGDADLPLHVIRNFSLEAEKGEAVPPKSHAKITAIFAGNLGQYHDLPLLVSGIAACFDDHPDLRLLFLGDGMAKAHLTAEWGNNSRIAFVPFLPFEKARPIIAAADIGLVSLLPGMTQVAYPSKIETYLSMHLPVLAQIDDDSQMARQIRKGGFGVVPKARTKVAVATAMHEAIAGIREMRQRAATEAKARKAEDIAGRWRHLFEADLSR